jgi:hypothetical protein
MGAPARQFCPLCRGELCMPDAVRTHLIADHKRSAAEADELIERFDTAKPIPEPEPHVYCASGEARERWTIGPRRRAGAWGSVVN